MSEERYRGAFRKVDDPLFPWSSFCEAWNPYLGWVPGGHQRVHITRFGARRRAKKIKNMMRNRPAKETFE